VPLRHAKRLTPIGEDPYNPVALEVLVQHSRRPGRRILADMRRIVLLQLVVTLVAAAVAALLAGMAAFWSALLGGLCCVVPNALFALRLFANTQKAGAANPMSFFIGELIKIALTVALLGAIAWLYRDLNWLALIASFIVVLKSYIILLFRH
jgi:ATP synthase protein I